MTPKIRKLADRSYMARNQEERNKILDKLNEIIYGEK